MAYVYILESQRNGKYYLGGTKDITRRLIQHRKRVHQSSKSLGPFTLVFSQEYPNLKTARYIESKLKRFKRRDYLEKIIRERRIKLLGPIAQSVRAVDS